MTLNIPQRLLMGPGPSNVHADVLAALARPTIGHLDPVFIALMDEIKSQLCQLLFTSEALVFPVSAPASAAMEMGLVNLIEPGDEAIICCNGVFGKRMVEIAGRCGAKVHVLEFEWGTPVDPAAVDDALKANPRTKLVGFVHGETSTGVLSDAEALCRVIKSYGALTVVDAVTSFAGVPVLTDKWGIDFLYTGTQKCLSCPPGLSPVAVSSAAMRAIESRALPVQSWFLDIGLINQYWAPSSRRTYHHTAPVNALYGLFAGLEALLDEGVENSWHRHRQCHELLAQEMSSLGLEFHVKDPDCRLPQLNTIKLPQGVQDVLVRKRLLDDYNIEIGAGLGPLEGKVWRIGLMGNTCRPESIATLIAAFKEVLS